MCWSSQFLHYARFVVIQPGLDYYKSKYLEESGDLYHLRQSAFAARVFDPFYLAVADHQMLCLLVESLKHFDYPEFTDEFLEKLKAELPRARQQAAAPFDWNSLKGSSLYDNRVNSRMRRQQAEARVHAAAVNEIYAGDGIDNREVHFSNWKDDPGERGQDGFGSGGDSDSLG